MDVRKGAERPDAGYSANKPHAGVSRRRSMKKVIGFAIALVVIVMALAVAALFLLNKSGTNNATASINKDDYQAVFLTNGQVYFGKLQNSDGAYLKLTDIYYLQVDSNVQQAGAEATDVNAQDDNSNVQLIKLGNELHGPRDAMQLNNDQVLFWENLKPDSRVSEAIANYKK